MRVLIILILAASVFGGAGYATWMLFIKPQEELKLERLMPPPPPPPDPTIAEFNKIVDLQKADKIAEARAGFADFVERYPESTRLDEAKNRLGELNTKLFFGKTGGPDKDIYVVKSGDVISKVANRTKAPPELIMKVNNLNSIMLRIGQNLVIPKADFSVEIDRKNRKVVVLNSNHFFKQYSIQQEQTAATPSSKKATPAPAKQPKVSGKVTDKIAWLNGGRVTFADKGFEGADHWIMIQPGGHNLYTFREVGPNETKPQKPPGGGHPLSPEAMQELAAMLNKNTPVTIE